MFLLVWARKVRETETPRMLSLVESHLALGLAESRATDHVADGQTPETVEKLWTPCLHAPNELNKEFGEFERIISSRNTKSYIVGDIDSKEEI